MGGILQDLRLKIKGCLADQAVFTALLLVLVSAASFGLGRQSVTEAGIGKGALEAAVAGAPATAASRAEPDASSSSTASAAPRFVASKKGQVYHLLICPGAKQISEANKIYFNTKEEAEAAGLRPAANCKGI